MHIVMVSVLYFYSLIKNNFVILLFQIKLLLVTKSERTPNIRRKLTICQVIMNLSYEHVPLK